MDDRVNSNSQKGVQNYTEIRVYGELDIEFTNE